MGFPQLEFGLCQGACMASWAESWILPGRMHGSRGGLWIVPGRMHGKMGSARISLLMLPRSDWNLPSMSSMVARMASQLLIWHNTTGHTPHVTCCAPLRRMRKQGSWGPCRGCGSTRAANQRVRSRGGDHAGAARAMGWGRTCSAHLLEERDKVVGLGQVVLDGLQLGLAQAHLVLPPILLGVAALVQDGSQHLVTRVPVQLGLHACHRAISC